MKMRHRAAWLPQLVLLGVVIAVLQLIPSFVPLENHALWAPLFTVLASLGNSPDFASAVASTAITVAITIALSIIIGLPCGLVLGRFKRVRAVVDPYLVALLSLPTFVIYPVLVVTVGLGRVAIVLASFIGGTVGMISSTGIGVRSAIERYEKVARAHRLGFVASYVRVYLPGCVLAVLAGMRLAFIYSFLGVIVTEFLLGGVGLGSLINRDYETFRVNVMLGAVVVVMVAGAVITVMLGAVERRIARRIG